MPDRAGAVPHVVQPSLFAYVLESAEAITEDPNSINRTVRGTDRLVLFLENFVVQYSANVLNHRIQGLNRQSLQEWKQQRRLLEMRPETVAAQAMMFEFEGAFTLIGELAYGATTKDAVAFRTGYVVTVLERITAWTEDSVADDELNLAAARAEVTYRKALGLA